MLTRLRNYALIAVAIGICYFLAAHHIIFRGWTDYDLLKKSQYTLRYTFISVRQIKPKKLLRVKNLRDAGLGKFLVKKGLISEAKLERILERIEEEIEAEFEAGSEN